MNCFFKYFPTLGTLFVSIIVACISYCQLQATREKFRFDLFQKRLAIYQDVEEFIWSLIKDNGGLSLDPSAKQFEKFARARNDSFFLFARDEEISKFLASLEEKARDLTNLNSDVSNKNIDERANKRSVLNGWFNQQLTVSKEKFAPYLSFRKKV